MSYFKSTSKLRAEISGDYLYVRNMESKGGVIDSIINVSAMNAVICLIQNITEESFSDVWGSLNKIKGVRMDYKSN